MANAYVHLWEFHVSPAWSADFERHYGPAGTWAQLFGLSPDHLGTLLLKDDSTPGRYLTIDRWRSEEAYVLFRITHAKQYAELDEACEQLTIDERSLGTFNELPTGNFVQALSSEKPCAPRYSGTSNGRDQD